VNTNGWLIILIFFLVLLFIISGCVTTKIGEIVPFGPKTYRIVGYRNTGDALIAEITIPEAIKYCESLNKHFMPVQGKPTKWDYTLIFSCLDENDPDLKRPEEGVE
jgi:hypothetical protein